MCADCFNDEALQRCARERAVRNKCDFCDCRKSKPIAAPFDDVVAAIRDGLKSCYTRELDEWSLGSESTTRSLLGDGDWQDPDSRPPIRNPKFLEEAVRAIGDEPWRQLTLTPDVPHGRLFLRWGDFCDRIQRKSRFFFSVPMRGDTERLEPADLPTGAILDELANLIRQIGLVSTLPPGTKYFRARQHAPTERFDSAKDLGPPPPKETRSNRMSPAGIVMFYGATEKETALNETYDSDGEQMLTVAAFMTLRPFKLIDLTHLPSRPSMFDAARRAERTGIFFLHRLKEEIAAPVVRDRRENVEYVPT